MNEKFLLKLLFENQEEYNLSVQQQYGKDPVSGYYRKSFFNRNADRELLKDTKELGLNQSINNRNLTDYKSVRGFSAYKLINFVTMKYRWKKNGCNRIAEDERRSQCLDYIRLLEFNDLKDIITKCEDDTCKILVRNQIQKIFDRFRGN